MFQFWNVSQLNSTLQNTADMADNVSSHPSVSLSLRNIKAFIICLITLCNKFLLFFVPGYKMCFPNPLCLKQIENSCCSKKLCFCDQDNDNFKFACFRENYRFAFNTEYSSRIFLNC